MSPCLLPVRPGRRSLLPACLFLAVGLAAVARADGLVVADCVDKTGAGMGRRVVELVRSDLAAVGHRLLDYGKYLAAARARKLDRIALKPSSVRSLAPGLGLQGVLTCAARREGKRFRIDFVLLRPDGKSALSRTYRHPKPWLLGATIEQLVDDVSRALPEAAPPAAGELARGPQAPLPPGPDSAPSEAPDDLALVPLVSLVEAEPVAPAAPKAPAPSGPAPKAPADLPLNDQEKEWKALLERSKPAAQTGVGDDEAGDSAEDLARFYPEDRVDSPDQPAPDRLSTRALTDKESQARAQATAARPAPVRKPRGPADSLPELFVAAGPSLHTRAGLSPRYQADAFPGLRIEGLVLAGALTDLPVLRDLGLAGMFDRGFGLKYTPALRPEKLAATEQHWRAELVYRLPIERWAGRELLLGPSLLLRFGYGETINTVDRKFPDVLSAAYSYTSGSLQANLWLVRSLLLVELAAGYLFDVWPSDSLSGNGSGVTFRAALAVELFDAIHACVGYEQLQFLFEDRNLGETSDRYQVFFLRVGYGYR